MARIFRAAVYGVVLGTCPQLTILRILRPLQALYDLHTHDARQIGVLTVGFLSPAPSRVAEDVHIWRPHAEAMELLVLTRAAQHAFVILCTELRRSHVETLIQQAWIKRRRHCYRLWEHGDVTLIGRTMQRLAPPEELLDTQTGDGGALVQHQHGLFLQRQS